MHASHGTSSGPTPADAIPRKQVDSVKKISVVGCLHSGGETRSEEGGTDGREAHQLSAPLHKNQLLHHIAWTELGGHWLHLHPENGRLETLPSGC